MDTQAAAKVFEEYVSVAGSAIGVWGTLVGEWDQVANQVECELPAMNDGGIAGNPEHHATVWFPMPPRDEMGDKPLKRLHDRIALDIHQCAMQRPALYRPDRDPR